MSRTAKITVEWADGEHDFKLGIGQLQELQEKTDVGPYTLLTRLYDGSWRFNDAREVLRLGLIGGGKTPQQALSLVKTYVDDRPLLESILPAQAVLAAAITGCPEEPLGKAGAAEKPAETTNSASPISMVPVVGLDTPPETSTI